MLTPRSEDDRSYGRRARWTRRNHVKKPLYATTVAVALAICVIGSAVFAASQNFLPDVVFKGSSLTGWHKLGQADWRADNGEIIAAPKESGGWLMLDKGYQDIAFYASFHCAGACKTGCCCAPRRLPTA